MLFIFGLVKKKRGGTHPWAAAHISSLCQSTSTPTPGDVCPAIVRLASRRGGGGDLSTPTPALTPPLPRYKTRTPAPSSPHSTSPRQEQKERREREEQKKNREGGEGRRKGRRKRKEEGGRRRRGGR